MVTRNKQGRKLLPSEDFSAAYKALQAERAQEVDEIDSDDEFDKDVEV